MSAVNCVEVRDAFLEGKELDSVEVERHVAECATCQALLEVPDLGRLLAHERLDVAPASPAVEAIVARALLKERGIRARLRALSTPARVGVALLGVLLLGAAQALRGAHPAGSLGVEAMGILVVLTCVGLLSTARARSPWENRALFAAGAMLPLLLWLVQGTSGTPSGSAGVCFLYGGAFAVPLVGLLWALDRRDRVPALDAALLGVTGGLFAALILELECASRHLPHLLAGHASVGWALIALLLGARSLRAR